MVPPITVGFWVKVFAFRVELVPFQKYKTKFAAMASVLVTVEPVPGITVLTVSLLFASSFGIFTTGAAPNAPDTATDAFALELAAPLELELALALGFDEPQPTMTRQASRGITVIARTRRMKTSIVGDVRRSQPTGCFYPGGRCWSQGGLCWSRGDDPPGTPRIPAAVLAAASRGPGGRRPPRSRAITSPR